MKPYPIPVGKSKDSESTIKDLISKGIIQESESLYSNAAIPIYKENGKIRLAINYRELNKITVTKRNLIPKITEITSQLKDSEIFSQFDLNSGYYQINLSKKSIPLSFFIFNGKK